MPGVIVRDGVSVTARTKVIEIDPRSKAGEVHGISERPRRIAEGVLAAIRVWQGGRRHDPDAMPGP
jgi:hypothetical protein